MTRLQITKLSAKSKISIPKSIRTARNWNVGQELALIPKGTGLMLVPVPQFEDLAGIALGSETSSYRDRND